MVKQVVSSLPRHAPSLLKLTIICNKNLSTVERIFVYLFTTASVHRDKRHSTDAEARTEQRLHDSNNNSFISEQQHHYYSRQPANIRYNRPIKRNTESESSPTESPLRIYREARRGQCCEVIPTVKPYRLRILRRRRHCFVLVPRQSPVAYYKSLPLKLWARLLLRFERKLWKREKV